MKKTKVTEYYPNKRHDLSTFAIWKTLIQNIRESKDLIFQLFKRDFFAQYKKSFIGVTWAFITPLFAIMSWVLMQATGVLNPGEVGVPYPIYILVGSSVWNLFIGLMNAASSTLTGAGGLLKQVKFHHEAILFNKLLLQLTTFAISFSLVLAGISFFGVIPHWQTILLPIMILPLLFYAIAAGLILAMVNVVAIDVSNFVNKFMNFLIYTVPVVYSADVENELLQLINKWNPLTYPVCSIRDLIIYGRLYDGPGLWISTATGFILFMLVWRAFYVGEHKLVERVI